MNNIPSPNMGDENNEEMPEMDDEQPDMNMGNESDEDLGQFDDKFDAGVEADEDEDPKTYIQQLTGKLSQTLRTYNNENEESSDLNKYVLGMIVKQGAKGLSDSDKKEIINKINSTDDSEDNDSDEDMDIDDSNDENSDMDSDEEINDNDFEDDIKNESKSFRFTKKSLLESFGITSQDEDKPKENWNNRISDDAIKSNKNKPFIPRKFK